jgi:hypothetical protein
VDAQFADDLEWALKKHGYESQWPAAETKPTPAPRYDEVFAQGVAWLDSLATSTSESREPATEDASNEADTADLSEIKWARRIVRKRCDVNDDTRRAAWLVLQASKRRHAEATEPAAEDAELVKWLREEQEGWDSPANIEAHAGTMGANDIPGIVDHFKRAADRIASIPALEVAARTDALRGEQSRADSLVKRVLAGEARDRDKAVAAARTEEREACATMADEKANLWFGTADPGDIGGVLTDLSEAIRARSEVK